MPTKDGGTVLKTSLSKEDEKEPQEALPGGQAAAHVTSSRNAARIQLVPAGAARNEASCRSVGQSS